MIDALKAFSARRPWAANAIGALAVIVATAAITALLLGRVPFRSVDALQRAEIEEIVHAYILENPEIIPEAISRLQRREVSGMISENRDEIETPFGSAWAGAEDGDVTLVEFFDYNCPYCRASFSDVERLLKEDKKLKVVYRDMPVLGEASQEAALASLAAAEQGKYRQFYAWMFTDKDRVSTQKTIQAVRAAGLNETRVAADMKSERLRQEVARNLRLGNALGLTGTPSYVIGNQIFSGAVGYDELKRAIAEARKNG